MRETTRIAIDRELDRARKKHNFFAASSERGISVIGEEFGEMAQAVNDFDKAKAKEEAFHVIATCIRFVEEL